MTRKHLYGQHFLRSPRLVAELVGHSDLKRNDTVYDFGAGSGVITSVLSRRVRTVFAVENEPGALALLRKHVQNTDNVQIVASDILQCQLPNTDYKVFSNPPFLLISELLQRLLLSAQPPQSIYLIAQRQFARKVVPSDQHFTSALGIHMAAMYTARIRKPLKKTDFTPPPGVDTVLLECKRRELPLVKKSELVSFCDFVSSRFENPSRITASMRKVAGVSPEKKPSEISPYEWLELYSSTK